MTESDPLRSVSPALLNEALRALFYESRDAVYALGLDGQFIEVNQALLDRLGYERDELMAIRFAPTVNDSSAAYVAEQFGRALAGETVRYLATGQRRDGSTFRADVINTPLVTNGRVVAVLGIAHDIDELEAARIARDSLEAEFELTLNAISDGLYFLDNDFVFTYVNPRGEQISQRSKDELIGVSLWEAFPLMLGSEFGIAYRRALAERIKIVVRERYEPYDVTLESTVYPTIRGLAIYVRDVTEEEASRTALAASALEIASQAALLDTARDAIIMRGLDHSIRYWNRAAADLYGWPADEVNGRSIRELLYRDATEFDAATEATIETGAWSGDIEQIARDGRVILSDCRWSLVRDSSGRPSAIFAVNTDVTVRRRQEETALRAQRLESLGTFAGGIAHDLNNVLTPLLMSVQLLASDETDDDKRATLSVIEASAKRGAAMMRQVLEFARGVEGRRMQVDVVRLLRDAELFCRETLPKSITVTTSIAVDAWQAVGDPTQLLQVLVNLVANARDAMPGGGTLQLTGENLVVTDAFTERVAAPGNYVLIRVEDTGTGMPREVVERVFEPFFTTKGIGEGTGLGLATSVSIVQSHGGAMRVHSEPGSGSRFDILIPAATAAEEPEKTPARPAEAPRGSGQLVLVADDEPDIRRAARLALESYGYRVAVVSNGQEALDYLIQFPGQTQLVFSDMAMPVMDGDALLAAIDDRFADLPVLLTSGLSLWSPAPATRRGFLAKPYSTDQLRAEIARLLTN